MSHRFAIRFDRLYGTLSTVLLLPPSSCYVEIAFGRVHVRMGWAFRATFALVAVRATDLPRNRPLSRGVHGWGGRWLVNGSGDGIVGIDLEPGARAQVMGVPVRLRRLLVSVEDPAGLRQALGKAP